MAKTKSVYGELLAQLNQYAERRAGMLTELKTSRARYETELAEIQRQLSKDIATMTPEEYRTKKDRMDDIFKEMDFVDERVRSIEASPAVTDTEFSEWERVLKEEDSRLRNEFALETYQALKQIVSYYEKAVTEFEKLRALGRNFNGALAKRDGNGCLIADLPPYSKSLMRFLLVYYNELDKQLNDGKSQTECYNVNAIREAHKEISDAVQKVGFAMVGDVNVPSWTEAYQELKYNKRWET